MYNNLSKINIYNILNSLMIYMVRTRFAPSPTGFLHIGSLRTALYSYAFAKSLGGEFVLRIEDTDMKRYVEGSIEGTEKILKSLGLKYDEGPDIGGPYAPYIQSKRLDIYRKKAEELVAKGKAYYCFCSEERLTKIRQEQMKSKKQPMYDRKCMGIPIEEAKERIKKGEKYVIRLKVPSGRKLELDDKLLGKVRWDSDGVDDQVLLKNDGFPTYHLAVVVDDIIMKISHITRGTEWLPSVPKHILIYEAFNYKFPIVAHMPVILDPEGGKLSKRKGNVSTEQFLAEGYLPEAILNFLMLLGWAPKNNREIFSLKEFVKEFSLERLNKSNPVFDRKKLLWFNGEYIRKYSTFDFTNKFKEWISNYYENQKMKKVILNDMNLEDKMKLIQERVFILSDAVKQIQFFYERKSFPDYSNIKGIKDYSKDDLKKVAGDYLTIIKVNYKDINNWRHDIWEKDIRMLADKYQWKHADMFMLIRLIICGSHISPPLFESMLIIGQKEIIARFETFLK